MKKAPHKNVYTRIGVSKIQGIGVIAVVDIPKGTYMFEEDGSEMVWIPEKELHLSRLDENIRKLYHDFCVVRIENGNRQYGCPDNFNNMTIAWYLNHSEEPNVGCDDDYDFYALRDITAGEELTVNYDTYSEE